MSLPGPLHGLPVPEAGIELPVAADGGRAWLITVLENDLVFREKGGEHIQRISRTAAPKALEIVGLAIERPLMPARVPTRTIFHLTRDQADVIMRWLSPLDEEFVRAIIHRHVVMASIPTGAIILLVALWRSGIAGMDLVDAGVGLGLIAIGLLGKVRPRQGLLLMNAGMCAAVVVLDVLRALQGKRWWLLALIALIAGYAALNVHYYRLITSLKGETPDSIGGGRGW